MKGLAIKKFILTPLWLIMEILNLICNQLEDKVEENCGCSYPIIGKTFIYLSGSQPSSPAWDKTKMMHFHPFHDTSVKYLSFLSFLLSVIKL